MYRWDFCRSHALFPSATTTVILRNLRFTLEGGLLRLPELSPEGFTQTGPKRASRT